LTNLNETERAFIVATMNRSRFYNASPSCFGTRALVFQLRIGYHDATRFAELLGLNPPRKSGTRWQIRFKGPRAEALLAEYLPEMTGAARDRAVTALANIEPSQRAPICTPKS
jgi:hypothetical protein